MHGRSGIRLIAGRSRGTPDGRPTMTLSRNDGYDPPPIRPDPQGAHIVSDLGGAGDPDLGDMIESSPMTTLWAIWTRLSIFTPLRMTVLPSAPRSMGYWNRSRRHPRSPPSPPAGSFKLLFPSFCIPKPIASDDHSAVKG